MFNYILSYFQIRLQRFWGLGPYLLLLCLKTSTTFMPCIEKALIWLEISKPNFPQMIWFDYKSVLTSTIHPSIHLQPFIYLPPTHLSTHSLSLYSPPIHPSINPLSINLSIHHPYNYLSTIHPFIHSPEKSLLKVSSTMAKSMVLKSFYLMTNINCCIKNVKRISTESEDQKWEHMQMTGLDAICYFLLPRFSLVFRRPRESS